MKYLYFLCNLVLVAKVLSDTSVKGKHISASLFTKWSETPLLLEAGEFIFRNSPNSFWPFVKEAADSKIFSSLESTNNKTYFDEILVKSKKYLSQMQYDLLRLSLSIRTYSPAIEMSRKLAEEANPNNHCSTFVDVHGKMSCDISDIQDLIDKAEMSEKSITFQFDKSYPISAISQKSSNKVVLILYGQIGSQSFSKFHEKILSLKGSFVYIFRHNFEPIVSSGDKNKIGLSGYGVELDIKNLEYKNKDDSKLNKKDIIESQNTHENKEDSLNGFIFDKLKQLNPGDNEKLDEFKKHLFESTLELAPLKAWQMQDLSLQAAQRMIEADSTDALSILEDVSQNFPMRARALSKIQLKKDLSKIFKAQRSRLSNAFGIEQGVGAMFLNGLQLNMDTIDIFSLSAALRKESKLLDSLHQVGLDTPQIKELVHLDMTSKSSSYGVDIRDTCVQWLNDLEKDKKYNHWAKGMQDILRPTYPGMQRSIARNFFNLVFIVDPAKFESQVLLKTAESFYVNDVPIRIGFVLVTNAKKESDGFKDASTALFRAHNYIKSITRSNYKALSFITDIYASSPKNKNVPVDLIVKEFKKRYPNEKNLEDIFGTDSDYDEGRLLTMDYYKKIGLRNLPQVLINGFPLSEAEIEGDTFEESIITKIMQLTQEIQMAVYKGELHDSMNLLDWLMNKEEIMPRLNPRILTNDRKFVAINEFNQELENFKYLSNEKKTINPLTLWHVSDPDTEKGRQLLYDSLNFFESSKISTRLAIILQKSSHSENNSIAKAISYAMDKLNSEQATKFIKIILRENNYQSLKSGKKEYSEILLEFNIEDLNRIITDYDISERISKNEIFLKNHTPFTTGDSIGLVANGWILGPFDETENFIDSDFSLLERFILKLSLKSVKNLVTKWNLESPDDKILMISCLLGKFASSEKRVSIPKFTERIVNIKPNRPDSPYYDILVILDPLTRHSQQISTILKVMAEITNVNITIYFNCKDKLSAEPLKSFYRYVLEAENKFEDGVLVKPSAFFSNMPQSPVLTMNIHSPESWMVEPVRSPFDLDNICLNEIDIEGAYGEFELEHIIVEGHAFDIIGGQPPRGLQFNLGTIANPLKYDTIVMANLGYFQLKSSPGMWFLQLRDGRSKDIYEVVSHENTESETKRSQKIVIVIDSFEGKIIRVKVSKKSDMVNENLLDDKEDKQEDESIWSSIATSFGGGGDNSAIANTKDEQNVLNIFSLASGHLYERLMRIMMLTVLKNTKAKVKFWFLKNYLSPEFISFMPYYAEKYGFDYELVQYKWPRWLHHESEKQRIIWGYKILFLDVLFPLNVEKIIYVDADQIVKADLTELRDINLKGAPYGYTPFCDSKKEMDGFRFWKQGYWQMHLAHRKYHISALYVVDLKKFRKLAAGDRLRGQYQGLSQDPNSLSNLDQDLPNNMIHQVNIFSLPQEWLYCDTWCSRDTLSKAKTIDLCNNPQTKEPKLDAARRIVPEWTDYDNEIKNLMEKWRLIENKIEPSISISNQKKAQEEL